MATKNGIEIKNRVQMVAESDVSNGASHVIGVTNPYHVEITIQGTADLLFNRWNCDEVDAKGRAGKGSSARKADNPELRVHRLDSGNLGIPGEYLRMAMVTASKWQRDPSSPRASGQRNYKAGVIVTTALADLGCKSWDYEDRRRAVIRASGGGINRIRPAMKAGWKAKFCVQVIVPELIDEAMLRETVDRAGKLCGLGDFRPTFGRFSVIGWEREDE